MSAFELTSAEPGSEWAAWTPALTAVTTSPTLGAGSQAVGRWLQIGKLVIATFKFDFGASGVAAGSGDYQVSLPTALSSSMVSYDFVGHGRLYDSDVNTHRVCAVLRDSTQTQRVVLVTDGVASLVTHASPIAWSTSDSIAGLLTYEAA